MRNRNRLPLLEKALARHVRLALSLAAVAPAAVVAGPEGGEIVAGSGVITRSEPGTTLITQGSERLAIDWQSFDVAAGERVRFVQPSADAAALNRIFDQNPSSIFGSLEANGRVYLVNPNGIVFGEHARIDVGALIASSLELPLGEFLAGRHVFEAAGGEAGPVVNRGLITAATGGSVTLLGGTVANEGLIVADVGEVTLGAGTRASLDFDGDGLLYFEIDGALLDNPTGAAAAVANSGTIRADGGQVLLTARAAQDVFSSVVNNGGAIRAARIDDSGGVVRLVGAGGNVVTTGAIDATGAGAQDTGGTVHVLGDRVGVLDGASIDVSGAAGGGTILVGGARGGAAGTPAATRTQVAADARLSASATAHGDGGSIVVWADDATWFLGDAEARGGDAGGDGGFVEISGKRSLVFSGTVSTAAPHGALGTLLFDPTNITIVDGNAGADDTALPDLSNATQGAGDFVISEQALEGLTADTNVMLEATNDITLENLDDDLLELQLGAAGNLQITADIDGDGSGAFTMDASDTIRTDGANVIIRGASLFVGGIDATGGSIALQSAGSATIAGDLTAGGLIAVAVDIDGNENATLTLSGTITAPTASLVGTQDVLAGDDAAADTFTLTSTGDGTLNGVAFINFGTLNGRGGDDVFNLAPGIDATIDGGAGTDWLLGSNQASTFTVSAPNQGTVAQGGGTVTFSAVEHLAGGTAGDTFTLQAALSGSADGGGGDDDFAVTADVGGALLGGAGQDSFTISASQSGGVNGGGDSDTLTWAGAGGAAFALTAADAGTLNGGAFSAVENLTGSGAADIFDLLFDLTGTASGLGGDDVFNLGPGVTAAIAGGAGTDRLFGSNQASTFTVNAANQGSVAQGAGTVTFSAIEHLAGGTANDTFTLQAALTGSASGGSGDDDFVVAADVGGALLGGAGADSFEISASQSGSLDGGGDQDTLTWAGAGGAAFALTAADAGTLNGGAFSAVENLTGSGAADIFDLLFDLTGTASGLGGDDVFNLGPGVTAAIAGGAGTDRLFGSNQASTFTVNAANQGSVAQGAGTVTFSAIEHLAGGTANDTFTLQAALTGSASGGSGDDDFVVTADVGGALLGGAGADSFEISASQSGSLDGGGDQDTLTWAGAGGAAFALTAADAGTLNGGAFSAVENLTGSGAADTFDLLFDLTGTASGLGGDDVFNLGPGVTAAIAGGAGTDRLFGSNQASTFTVNAANQGSVAQGAGTVTFSAVEHLSGGTANDTFTLQAALSGSASGGDGDDDFVVTADAVGALMGGAGQDSFEVTASQSGTLDAGADADTVTLAPGTTFAGALTGGAGGGDADTLAVGGSAANNWLVTSTDAGLVNGQLFTEFENLTGGGGSDVVTLIGPLTGTVDGGGGDDAINVLGGGAAAIVGGAGTDSLSYAGSLTPVTVNVTTLTANGIEIVAGSSASGDDVLLGTAGSDEFVSSSDDAGTVNGVLSYSSFEFLQGQGGADRFVLRHRVSGGADGGAGDDAFEVANGAAITGLTGGAGLDSLTLLDGSASYTVSAPDAGTLNGVAFAAIENLVGTAAADTFTLASTLSGTASGLDGDDVFQLAAGGAATIDGGAGSDTLAAATGQATAFEVTSANAGTADNGGATVTFTSVENLTGSSQADTFVLGADLSGTAEGGAGADSFVLAAGVSAALAGGAGDDRLLGAAAASTRFTVSSANAGTAAQGAGTVVFTGVEHLVGGAADDEFQLAASLTGTASGGGGDDLFVFGAGVSATVAGDAGADTLRADAAAAFEVTATNAGTAASGGGIVTFAAVENLEGSASGDSITLSAALTGTAAGRGGDDVFAIRDGGSAGAIDGGTGLDTQTYAASTGPVTVSIGSLLSIEQVVGSADAGDTLVGTPGADTFATTGLDAGTVAGIAYSGFEHLQGQGGDDVFVLRHDVTGLAAGGDGDDDFELGAGAAVAVDGGAGTDTLRGSAEPTVFAVTAADAGEAVSGGAIARFTSIERLEGGAGADTFRLDAALSAGAAGGGGDDVFHVNVDAPAMLDGGDGADVFNLAANVTASVRGGAGVDSLVADAGTPTAFAVTATNAGTATHGAATVDFVEIERLVGSGAADHFALDASLDGTAIGGAGDDTFVLAGSASAGIDGGAGDDTVTGADTATVFTVQAAHSGTAATGAGQVTLTGVERLEGGAAADTFRLLADFAGTITGGAGDDRFEVEAHTSGALLGGDGADAYAIADGVVASGVVDGGGGADTLDFSAYSSPRNVVLTARGVVDGFDGGDGAAPSFRNIDAVIGDSSGRAALTGTDSPSTWSLGGNGAGTYDDGAATLSFAGFSSLTGGAAADRFALGDGAWAGSLTLRGGAGSDRLDLDGSVTVDGDLTLDAIETVAGSPAGFLTANALTIAGATNGIGSPGDPLRTALATLRVTASDGGLFLVDAAGGLHVPRAEAGTGDVRIEVEEGDLSIGYVDAGGGGEPFTPPPAGTGGNVVLIAARGSIARADGEPVNVRGDAAFLQALLHIGAPQQPITIVIPSTQTITLAGTNATINNVSLATVDDALVAGVFSDVAANATAAAVGAGAATSLLDVAAIDWAGLDPNVALIDCLEPCILLPPDQREDDGFAALGTAKQILLLRVGGAWKAIPLLAAAD